MQEEYFFRDCRVANIVANKMPMITKLYWTMITVQSKPKGSLPRVINIITARSPGRRH